MADGYYTARDWRGFVAFSVYGSDGVTEIQSEEEYDFVFRATETGKYYLRAFTNPPWAIDDYRALCWGRCKTASLGFLIRGRRR